MKNSQTLWRRKVVGVFLGLALVLGCTLSVHAQDAKWMRYSAISPDGSQIAFSYQGDIWVVSADGGPATALTTHQAYERSPVWSPDGSQIAYATDRHGNFDVYTISASGGAETRLTYHSSGDVPTSFADGGDSVLFTSRRQDAADSMIGSGGMSELYSIPITGGRPRQILTTTAEFANFNRDGKRVVFHDYKGFEDLFRKHHTSSVTRDIWFADVETGQYTKVSNFPGEDLNPVWSTDGNSIYYLSGQTESTSSSQGEHQSDQPASLAERQNENDRPTGNKVIPQHEGTINVWKVDVANLDEQQRVTSHEVHPVRYLSIAGDGTLCYGFNGDIYVKRGDEEPQRVEINVTASSRANAIAIQTFTSGATEFAVSPNEEEVAFIVRGEVFVANVEYGTTKRITDTPEQERSVCWGSDNRTLYYAGERDNSWNLYAASIANEDEDAFANSTIVTEESLLVSDDETFQPLCSPDGKHLAYLKNRTELMVMDLDTRKSSTLVPAKSNFSYADGDIEYRWSPDSRWLTFTYHGHESWITEVGAANLADGEIINVTNSGYNEAGPLFAGNGTAILYSTDRYGEKSHGSWGGESDVMAIYLTQEAYDEATLDKEQLELRKKQKKNQKSDEAEKEDKEEKSPSDDKKEKDVEPVKFETEDKELRIRRMTLHSSALGAFDLSPDGEHLLYAARVDDKWALWLCKVRDRSTANVLSLGNSGPGHIQFAKDGKSAFVGLGGGRIAKVSLGSALSGGGKASSKPIGFTAEMNVNSAAERQYIFDHAWRQVQRKFYEANLHGVDWELMRENYSAFLPSINNNHDFAELLSEMLGELNASHTGARYRPRNSGGDSTASFGLLYDVNHDGVGLKVAEVIDRGPCDTADCKIEAGTIITHINGDRLTPDVNPYCLLNRLSGKPVRLKLHDPDADEEWEETIRPFSTGQESNLLYERWIATRRELCNELSDGQIGYVHVRGMNDGSFRRVYSEVLGENNEKKALIVDTRFNGGGWLHEDLATFLDGERYCYFAPRGHEDGGLGGEPINKWTRPVVVLQSESNYSDAHFFPWAFKQKGVGKLVGAPVPGTATAVWWETQIDNSIVFGIPQVGMITLDGEYLENNQLEPDILVINDPQSVSEGKDLQLEAAVKELQRQLNE